MQPAREQEVLAVKTRLMHPSLQNCSGLLSDFKLHWMLSFLLHQMARDDTCSPWAMSRTRNLVKSQARSLLSMAKLKSAKSRVFSAS
jgi:hypothetical protein